MTDIQTNSSGSIPSNTVINPRALNFISLRSRRKGHFKAKEAIKEDIEDFEVENPLL